MVRTYKKKNGNVPRKIQRELALIWAQNTTARDGTVGRFLYDKAQQILLTGGAHFHFSNPQVNRYFSLLCTARNSFVTQKVIIFTKLYEDFVHFFVLKGQKMSCKMISNFCFCLPDIDDNQFIHGGFAWWNHLVLIFSLWIGEQEPLHTCTTLQHETKMLLLPHLPEAVGPEWK